MATSQQNPYGPLAALNRAAANLPSDTPEQRTVDEFVGFRCKVIVGWVERSEPHQNADRLCGGARAAPAVPPLDPPYMN
jgi:hypothetical protein